MSIWVLAADSARARILQFESRTDNGDFVELAAMTNPFGRLKEEMFIADAPGSHTDGSGRSKHAVESKHSAKNIASQKFAKDVASSLKNAYQKQIYSKLYIVAAPEFLGQLRTQLPETIKQSIAREIDRNVTTLSVEKIRQLLPKRL